MKNHRVLGRLAQLLNECVGSRALVRDHDHVSVGVISGGWSGFSWGYTLLVKSMCKGHVYTLFRASSANTEVKRHMGEVGHAKRTIWMLQVKKVRYVALTDASICNKLHQQCPWRLKRVTWVTGGFTEINTLASPPCFFCGFSTKSPLLTLSQQRWSQSPPVEGTHTPTHPHSSLLLNNETSHSYCTAGRPPSTEWIDSEYQTVSNQTGCYAVASGFLRGFILHCYLTGGKVQVPLIAQHDLCNTPCWYFWPGYSQNWFSYLANNSFP